MTVRKNFLLDDEIAKHLEAIAKKENTTQTNVIKNMIEEKYQQYSREEKLEAFYKLKGCMNGLIGSDVSVQSVKMEMGSKI